MDIAAIDSRLFASISGHAISSKAVSRTGQYTAFELTYGEVTPKAVETFVARHPEAGSGVLAILALVQARRSSMLRCNSHFVNASAWNWCPIFTVHRRKCSQSMTRKFVRRWMTIGALRRSHLFRAICSMPILPMPTCLFACHLLWSGSDAAHEAHTRKHQARAHAIIANPLKIESDALEEILVEPCDMGWELRPSVLSPHAQLNVVIKCYTGCMYRLIALLGFVSCLPLAVLTRK